MDGSLVEPDWPPLTLEEVRTLLARFAYASEPIRILSASPRPFSAAGVVAAGEGKVFVKRHHRTVRNAEGLREEHNYMAHLRARGVAVPRVYATGSGETAVEAGEWTYEVHQVPPGVDLYEDAISWTPFFSAAHAHAAGQALARLHLASEGYAAPRRNPRPLVASFTIFSASDPAEALAAYLAARPALRADRDAREGGRLAIELLAPFHAEILPLLPALPPLWTHNDLHASNLFWSERGLQATGTAIIDFGLADRTHAVYDLAQTIERNIVEWLALVRDPDRTNSVPVHLDHLHALLHGYQSVRRLSRQEAASLAPMTALCHAEFALTEADYFLAALQAPDKARMASIDYLVGHAQWFRSTHGQSLLHAIRQCIGASR